MEFFVGDRVWKKNKVLSDASKSFTKKLAPRYILCSVKKKFFKLAYELVDENNRNQGVWHIKDLKPYKHVFANTDDDTEYTIVKYDVTIGQFCFPFQSHTN